MIATRHLLWALLLLVGLGQCVRAAEEPRIEADVVYGHKDGLALTMDVLHPPQKNGAGILMLRSGGWYSRWEAPVTLVPAARPLLDKGFTVFVVYHGSAPKYTVPEALDDVRRSVRYVRWRAREFGIDPERLGVTGRSAGGHLTLMLATTADAGDPNAKDEVLRQSSRIAAAVSFFPPTDLRSWVTNPPPAIARIPSLKPPLSFDPAKEPEVSPILHVSADDAPTLLIHGDRDELVPIEHSRNIMTVFTREKVTSDLLVIEGAGHSFSPPQNDRAVAAMAAWFDKHLPAPPQGKPDGK